MPEQPPDIDEGPILDFPDPAFGETDDDDIESPLPGEESNEGGIMEGSTGSTLLEAQPIKLPVAETKPATQTSEFWTMLITQGLLFLQLTGIDVADQVQRSQNPFVLVGMAVLGGLYAVGRGRAKAGVPYYGPQQ